MDVTSEPRTHDDDQRNRLERYHRTRCPRLRAQLIQEYYWIAEMVARRYRGKGEPYDDILQVAALGVVAALDRYDPNADRSFPAFAVPTAFGEVRRHFRDRTWRIRVPRGVKELSLQITRVTDELTADLDREPTLHELADRLGVSAGEVERARVAAEANHPLSVDPGGDPRRATVAEIPDGARPDPHALADERLLVDDLLERLSGRERLVVELRFFAELSQDEIARRVGVSQPHVSRILRSALAHLRAEGAEV